LARVEADPGSTALASARVSFQHLEIPGDLRVDLFTRALEVLLALVARQRLKFGL